MTLVDARLTCPRPMPIRTAHQTASCPAEDKTFAVPAKINLALPAENTMRTSSSWSGDGDESWDVIPPDFWVTALSLHELIGKLQVESSSRSCIVIPRLEDDDRRLSGPQGGVGIKVLVGAGVALDRCPEALALIP